MLSFLSILLPLLAWADPCAPGMKEGEECVVAVGDLLPTQPHVGEIDVEAKRREIRGLGEKALKAWSEGATAFVVIGPGGKVYLVDGHHKSRAALLEGVPTMKAEVLADFSDLSEKKFWKKMRKRGWVRLVNRNLRALRPQDLPKSLARLTDDPYRALAWVVLKSGAFEKTDQAYAEYEWADFFRKRIPSLKDWEGAVKEGIRLATISRTEHLPGHSPIRSKRSYALQQKRLAARDECWARFEALALPHPQEI